MHCTHDRWVEQTTTLLHTVGRSEADQPQKINETTERSVSRNDMFLFRYANFK